MKNILKISLIVILTLSLMFGIVACGGDEETPAPDNGGENNNGGDTNGGDTNGGDTNGGDTNGGDTNGGDTNGGDTNGGDTNGGDTNDNPIDVAPDPDDKWGEFVPIG
ncbi:MAG: hypothetical protein IJW49_05150 [Clostridia bacterium]|nr:hypothetical protein [Clostridia bacterium]